MDWIDSIKKFFQDIYDSVIGQFADWFLSVSEFFTVAFDIVLILIVLFLAYVIFRFLKILTVPMIILAQIVMLTAIITAMLAFVAMLATALVSIYNRIYSLSDYLGTDGGASCLGYMFDCLAVSGILSTYFTELFALFVTVLLIRVSGLFMWALEIVSDKIWRLGVLLGLA